MDETSLPVLKAEYRVKQRRKQSGYVATMAAFKCTSCGFCFSQSVKWSKTWVGAHGVPVCLNKECGAKGAPLKRLGKLTTDQLNNGETIYFDKLTTSQGKTKVAALQEIEAIRSASNERITDDGFLEGWDDDDSTTEGGETNE